MPVIPITNQTYTSLLLRDKGMKATVWRRRVLELFLENHAPLSHAEVSEMLAASGPKPDKVTLYRVLSAFSAAKIVHVIRGMDGAARFCLHDASLKGCPGNHPHFICRKCKQMLCIHDQPLPHVEVPEGASVEGKQMLVFGLCPQCAAGFSKGASLLPFIAEPFR